MKVLSLFDGMSGAQQALKYLNINIDKYYASEIDKYAIAVTQYNFPETIQLGDINNWKSWDIDEGEVDLIIGGSPCQGFSVAGRQLNFNDPRSILFFKYVEVLEYYKSRYFLLENVKMKKEWQDIITSYMKHEPVLIDSALVSAQGRRRLYWTNINNGMIEQPEDLGIKLLDIIENGSVDREKSYTIDANYWKGGSLANYLSKSRRQIVLSQSERRLMVLEPDTEYNYRMLSPLECERLQTFPDNYSEFGNFNGTVKRISNTQRYKMLGNAFTVKVIEHILSYIKQ